MYWIIVLRGVQHHREISHRLICLGKDTTDSKITRIHFNYMNGRLKSGKCRTRAWVRAYFSASKAC